VQEAGGRWLGEKRGPLDSAVDSAVQLHRGRVPRLISLAPLPLEEEAEAASEVMDCSALVSPYTGSILFICRAAFTSSTVIVPALERRWNLCACCAIFFACTSTTGSSMRTSCGLSAGSFSASATSCSHCSLSADMLYAILSQKWTAQRGPTAAGLAPRTS